MDLLYPPVCLLCNELAEQDELFCHHCVEKLATPEGKYCKRCGGKLFEQIKETANRAVRKCSRCQTAIFRFKKAIVLGEYEGDLRNLILQMKTERNGILARAVAELLTKQRAAEFQEAAANLIVPVPMYRWRRWERGVNSPDLLAEELGRILKIPVNSQLVCRKRATDLQYMLSGKNRATNVYNAFGLRRLSTRLEGLNILLVDDILTTGSTCNEVTKVLKQAGAVKVTVCAFARAEGFYSKYRKALLNKLAHDEEKKRDK